MYETYYHTETSIFDRKIKFCITNMICILTLIIMLWLTWYYVNKTEKKHIFLCLGILLLLFYIFKEQIFLLFAGLILFPSSVIDNVPIGCTKTNDGNVFCPHD